MKQLEVKIMGQAYLLGRARGGRSSACSEGVHSASTRR
jgi:hypothetical protein